MNSLVAALKHYPDSAAKRKCTVLLTYNYEMLKLARVAAPISIKLKYWKMREESSELASAEESFNSALGSFSWEFVTSLLKSMNEVNDQRRAIADENELLEIRIANYRSLWDESINDFRDLLQWYEYMVQQPFLKSAAESRIDEIISVQKEVAGLEFEFLSSALDQLIHLEGDSSQGKLWKAVLDQIKEKSFQTCFEGFERGVDYDTAKLTHMAFIELTKQLKRLLEEIKQVWSTRDWNRGSEPERGLVHKLLALLHLTD